MEAVMGGCKDCERWKIDRAKLVELRQKMCTDYELTIERFMNERDAARARLAELETQVAELAAYVEIPEPICVEAPCWKCRSAPMHAADCIHKPGRFALSALRTP
jgi:hypothetical protein